MSAPQSNSRSPLGRWLQVRPGNAVTVLDTHDGIGVVDVGPSDLVPGVPGLMAPEQIDALVQTIHTNSGGTSRQATGASASNLDLYQVNCTFYDALARDDRRYLLARLVQLFVPGVPQVYDVGLLAGTNDMDLLQASGVGRDVNRHSYTRDEVELDLRRPVVRAQLAALHLRREHPAFHGQFSWTIEGTRAKLTWSDGENCAELVLDVRGATFELRVSNADALKLALLNDFGEGVEPHSPATPLSPVEM